MNIPTPEFKPCPFCGEKVFPLIYGYSYVEVRVSCSCGPSPHVTSTLNGGVNLPTLAEMLEEVAKEWNMRAPE